MAEGVGPDEAAGLTDRQEAVTRAMRAMHRGSCVYTLPKAAARSYLAVAMTKLPPPIWMFIFLVLTGAGSYFGHIPANLRFWPAGVLLIVVGFAIAMTAVAIFRREGTEIDPMSATNKHLVVRGPFRFTRNPMYLGL